jgi:hypothetical protein
MRAVRVLPSLALLAVVPATTADADSRADAAKLRGELITAINKRDVAGVTSRVSLPLRLSNMVFVAPACTQFAGKTQVLEADLAAFVACLADLGVKDLTGADDVFVNAVYGPGFPLVFANAPVTTLYAWSMSGSDMFTIEPVTFASHIKKFTREIVPAAPTKKTIDASSTEHAEALLTVCVDGRGKVKALAQVHDEAFPSYAEDVEKAAGRWSIKPFALGGKAIEACARFTVGYPADRIGVPLQTQLPQPPPPPSPPPPPPIGQAATPQNVAPTLLEGNRIAGQKLIVPDDKTKIAIQDAKRDKVVASFKLCLDDTGVVTKVVTLKSSGFPDYDAKITREMNKWAYRPYLVNDQAVPVCTAVTFIYSQK